MNLTTTPDGIFKIDISNDEMVIINHKGSNNFVEIIVDPYDDLDITIRENLVRQ